MLRLHVDIEALICLEQRNQITSLDQNCKKSIALKIARAIELMWQLPCRTGRAQVEGMLQSDETGGLKPTSLCLCPSSQLLDCFVIPVVLLLSWFFLLVRYKAVHFVGAGLCLLGVGCMVGADILLGRQQGLGEYRHMFKAQGAGTCGALAHLLKADFPLGSPSSVRRAEAVWGPSGSGRSNTVRDLQRQ